LCLLFADSFFFFNSFCLPLLCLLISLYVALLRRVSVTSLSCVHSLCLFPSVNLPRFVSALCPVHCVPCAFKNLAPLRIFFLFVLPFIFLYCTLFLFFSVSLCLQFLPFSYLLVIIFPFLSNVFSFFLAIFLIISLFITLVQFIAHVLSSFIIYGIHFDRIRYLFLYCFSFFLFLRPSMFPFRIPHTTSFSVPALSPSQFRFFVPILSYVIHFFFIAMSFHTLFHCLTTHISRNTCKCLLPQGFMTCDLGPLPPQH